MVIVALSGCSSGADTMVNGQAASTGTTALAPFPSTPGPSEPAPPSNRAPTITGSPQTSARPGIAFAFQPSAADADGDALIFSVSNRPAWITFNTSTGVVQGTPTDSDIGTYAGIVISVSDGGLTAQLPAFTITVAQTSNGSTVLSWTPPTQNSNGTTLTDLAGYVVEYGMNSAALNQSVRLTNPGLTTYMLTDLLPGTWFFALRAFNSTGAESVISNQASKIIP